LKEESRWRMFENGVLNRIFGPKREENYIMRSLMICSAHQIYSSDEIENNEMGWACSTYGKQQTFWYGNVGQRDKLAM
jgi:hypothetical protein